MTETEDVKNIQEAPEANESLEESFARLDVLAERLEDPQTSLEESFRLYRQGMELLKLCSEKLDTVEKKMLQLNEDGTYSEF
ncbi:MAG: exodeoxyribonuclease VII small subunit [Clostridiales bacterium]|nr:exodeoxyribonuclease VII small subunit [Clostridiales bacterium]